MATLIEKTSALYKRRLVKEIRNSSEHGVYFDRVGEPYSIRVENVRFSKGHIEIKDFFNGWSRIADSEVDNFRDGYGRDICATRVDRR